MKHIKTALSIVDEARVLDNSSKDDPFQQVIVMKSGNYEVKVDPLPEWARDLLPPNENSTRNILTDKPQMLGVICLNKIGEATYPHNMKVYNLCRIKAVGIDKWIEESVQIRKKYFTGKFVVGKGQAE